jgi:hypothetical protein
MKKPTEQDKKEFKLFCQQATDNQVLAIFEKETKAKRWHYAAIAKIEIEKRGLSND